MTTAPALRIGLSLLLATAIGWLAWRRGSLTGSGWAAAVVVGTLTAGLGGWAWGGLVVVFFVSSTLLSHVSDRRKGNVTADFWEKGTRRDAGQVLANGGLFALLAIVWWLSPLPLIWTAAVGIMATVTGDTWATEIGVLSRTRPRLITTLRPVAEGTSGAISTLGTLAAVGGAAAIAIAAWLFGTLDLSLSPLHPGWAALIGGVVGVLCDSLLGATVQAMRWCPQCRTETERLRHRCGTTTEPLRGIPWLRNDAVNMVSSIAGGLVAVLLAQI